MQNKAYTVEREDSAVSHRHWFKITDTRTGNVQRSFAGEFWTGTMHYDEATAKYPRYVHEAIWRLVK